MPGKSRHGGRKRSFQGKRKKDRQSSLDIGVSQQIEAQTIEPVRLPKTVTPSMMETVSAPAAVRRPYILTELWRISIVAGIMLIILVVLALTLS